MHRIITAIEVNASAARVWEVLLNFPAHAEWNPFIQRIVGDASPGSTLQVTVQHVDGRAMSFAPQVLACVTERELRWRGKVLFTGLFDGVHAFQVMDIGQRSSRFVHEEVSGVLVPLLMREAMRAGTHAGFDAMNRALKACAEQSAV